MEPSDEATFPLLGLRMPWKATLVIILSTLLLTFDFYYDILNNLLPPERFAIVLRNLALDRLGLFFIIPLGMVLLVFRDHPSRYGLTWGDWRAGAKWTLGVWFAVTPILYLAARAPAMMAYYTPRYGAIAPVEVVGILALDLFSWEFLFRGFMLFALYRIAGPSAVVLQAVPFALAHLGKPPLETLSTIFGGTAFGWVAWRTRSFVYPYLMHLYIMVLVALLASRSG